jgi:hypothetical protein
MFGMYANDDAIRILKVVDRGSLFQELGIAGDMALSPR